MTGILMLIYVKELWPYPDRMSVPSFGLNCHRELIFSKPIVPACTVPSKRARSQQATILHPHFLSAPYGSPLAVRPAQTSVNYSIPSQYK